MPSRRVQLLLVWLVSLCLLSVPVLAQETPTLVRLNENAFGTLTGEEPSARFILTSSGIESVLVQVFGVGSGFAPRFRVLDPAGSVVFDVGNPDGLSTVEGTAFLADAGAYTIEVDGENGSTGQFVLSLEAGALPPAPVDLLVGEPVSAVAGGESLRHIYQFALSQPAALSVLSDAAESGPSVSLHDDTAGLVLATSSGGSLTGVIHLLNATDILYRVEVSAAGSTGEIPFTICLGCVAGSAAPIAESALEPASPVAVASPAPVSTACNVVSSIGGSANIRSGPSTNFSIVGSLQPGQSFPATGQIQGGGWFQINVNGVTGWIGGSVSRLDGDCAALPVVAAPAAPPPPAIPAPTAIPTVPPAPPPPVATDEVPPLQSIPPGDAPNTDELPPPPVNGSSSSGGSGDFVPDAGSFFGETGSSLSDLFLSDLRFSATSLGPSNNQLLFSTNIINSGSGPSGASILRMCYVYDCVETPVLSLPAGGSYQVYQTFTYNSTGEKAFIAAIDAYNQVIEVDEGNNVYTGQAN